MALPCHSPPPQTMHLARSCGVDVTDAVLILKQRVTTELEQAMTNNPEHDIRILSDAIRQAK